MELETTKAVMTTTRELPCPVQEQSVELDYVLPDYYPDVCTLVKAFVTPVIESQSIQSGRLTMNWPPASGSCIVRRDPMYYRV